MQTATSSDKSLVLPVLGIGTWAWGDRLFWSYGKDYGIDQVREAFNASLASGIMLFDTAEVYGLGESERLIGKFIKERPETANQLQIATKYFPLPWRFNADAVHEAITASLRRLQLQKIDLYQVHQPFSFLMSQKTLMNALADEVERGRIGAIGVSNYSATQMRQAYNYLADRGIPLVANQVLYSLLARQIETNGVMTVARELGVDILAYSPLAQGLLTGKYVSDRNLRHNLPKGARRVDPRFSPQGLAKVETVIALLRQLAEKYERTPAQVALNWLIAQSKNQCQVIPIPGAKTAEQARQNAGAIGWSLPEAEIGQLDEATAAWKQ